MGPAAGRETAGVPAGPCPECGHPMQWIGPNEARRLALKRQARRNRHISGLVAQQLRASRSRKQPPEA